MINSGRSSDLSLPRIAFPRCARSDIVCGFIENYSSGTVADLHSVPS